MTEHVDCTLVLDEWTKTAWLEQHWLQALSLDAPAPTFRIVDVRVEFEPHDP